MLVVSENDCREDKSILALLSAYQECLVTFKSMTSQLVQRARPLTTRSVVSSQRVDSSEPPAARRAVKRSPIPMWEAKVNISLCIYKCYQWNSK